MRVWLAVALTLICTAVFGHGSEEWINNPRTTRLADTFLDCIRAHDRNPHLARHPVCITEMKHGGLR